MTDPSTLLQQLFNAGAIQQSGFAPGSRYYGLGTLSVTGSDGTTHDYVTRRFIPPPESFGLLQRYRVQLGDRVDVIAANLLGNPLSYWQICDANLGCGQPSDVTAEPGSFIVITLPAGVPGA